jgi:hypothetical protein
MIRHQEFQSSSGGEKSRNISRKRAEAEEQVAQ